MVTVSSKETIWEILFFKSFSLYSMLCGDLNGKEI